LQESLNTVYYAVGEDKKAGMSPATVLDMAYDLGIKQVWAGAPCGGKRLALNGSNGDQIWPRCLGADLSFGAYGVTRLATLRTIKSSPGSASKITSGGTRESQHPISMIRGFCPASAK
jgi:hypothetical protein